MVDRKHRVGLSGTPSLTQEDTFKKAAGQSVPAAQDTVSSNAKAQVEAKAMHEQGQTREDARWLSERQKIASGSAPSPDLGAAPTYRDVQKEYTERKAASDQRKEAITREYTDRKTDIRENGATLTKAFDAARTPGAPSVEDLARPQPESPTQENLAPAATPEPASSAPEQSADLAASAPVDIQKDFANAAGPTDIPVHDNTPSLGHSR